MAHTKQMRSDIRCVLELEKKKNYFAQQVQFGCCWVYGVFTSMRCDANAQSIQIVCIIHLADFNGKLFDIDLVGVFFWLEYSFLSAPLPMPKEKSNIIWIKKTNNIEWTMRQQWNNENHSTPIPNQDWNYLEKNKPIYSGLFRSFSFCVVHILFAKFNRIVYQIVAN